MRPLSSSLLILPALLVASCSGSSGNDNAFEVKTAPGSLDPTLSPLLTGIWMVYARSEALEAGGTDLNGDMDTLDQVAAVVRLGKSTFTDLAVASTSFAGLNNEIFLVVEEALDGTDWNMDGFMDDDVLLHWSNDADVVSFVDTLDSASNEVITVGLRAYYTADAGALMGDESNLRYVLQGDPLTPVPVLNTAGGGPLGVELIGEDQGLLFMISDETEDGVDRNLDADTSDVAVLALLDGTDSAARIVEVNLALRDEDAPFAAKFERSNDWVVGFLVDEAQEGMTNFNPPILDGNLIVPDSCQSTPDVDTNDQVLFWLRFEDFATGADIAHNTGIAGDLKVVAVDDYVATLSPELDATCDYNEDGTASDTMVRWIEALVGSIPPRDPTQLHAVEISIPGGSNGLASVDDRLVCVVSEFDDMDDLDGGKPAFNNLVAWLDPNAGPATTWTFMHESSNPNFGTGLPGEPYAGASWLAPEEDEGRLGVGFQESVPGLNLNNFSLGCDVLAKDADTNDSLPVWMDFENGPTLDFDGVGFAVETDEVGLTVSRGWAFFRVSEIADATDYNEDGDMLDLVIMRNPLLSCMPRVLATAHTEDTPAVFTDDEFGAAFFSSEFAAGVDLNGDGDINDTVLRHFEF